MLGFMGGLNVPRKVARTAWIRAFAWVVLFPFAGASAQSASAAISIDSGFVLNAAADLQGQILLQWPSLAGASYQVFWSSDLVTAPWVPLGDTFDAAGPQTSVEQEADDAKGFFRVAQVGAPVFRDDFETGSASQWDLDSGWKIRADGGAVLNGEGHHWARLAEPQNWRDFSLRLMVKLTSGGIHLNYRLNDQGRYFIWFGPDGTKLSKQYWPSVFLNDLATSPIQNDSDVWHTVEIHGEGNRLKVVVDGQERIDYSDPDPLLLGTIAFEALEDSHVHVDDVSIIGPPQTLPDPNLVWRRTGGPLGGIGYDIRVDPTNPRILYVTDAWSGVSKSEDGGASWTPINQGITSRTGPSGDAIPVFSLTIDPRNPGVLWIGTQGTRGVYKSKDGGLNWARSENGIPDLPGMTFRSFTIHPDNSDIVFAGTEIPTDQVGPDGQTESAGKIYRTTDGGRNWTEMLDAGALVRWIEIDPANPQTLYAATGIFDRDDAVSEGILKSTDGGRTWRRINNGLSNLTVGGLVMDPRDPEVLYAATGRNNGFGGGPTAAWGGVYKSTDGGEHWVEVLHRPSDFFPVTAITLAPSEPDIVYAALSGNVIYRSRDAGRTWKSFNMDPDGASVGIPIAVTVDPQDSGVVYVNSYIGGIFKSSDGGENWHIASQGYTGAQVSDVGIDPSSPAVVFAVGRQGISKSVLAGNSWTYLNRGGANQFTESAGVSINPGNPLDVLVASRFAGTILRTQDGGETWRAVADAVPDDIYPSNLHGLVQFARFAKMPDLIYAAGRMAAETFNVAPMTRSVGVHKSINGGDEWQPVNSGLPADLNINGVAVHPTDPNIVLAATLHRGLYRTSDGGVSWEPAGRALAEDVRAVAFDRADPNLIYAGTENQGLFVSEDGGESWQSSGLGLEPNASIHSFAVDPAQAGVVWAADYRSGVYRSVDAGKTWVQINAGLRTRAVNALAISADGQVIYAATEGEGVFRLGAVSGVAEIGGVVRDARGPVDGAIVQVQATDTSTTTDSIGRFSLKGLDINSPVSLSAWAPGYYIAGGKTCLPGENNVEFRLRELPSDDNPDYQWRSAFSSDEETGNCQDCHADPDNPNSALPFDEWRLDARGRAAANIRFLTMYSGTDVEGHRSPLTRHAFNQDYGTVPLPPDPTQTYYGPGYKLDFPEAAGNCAACHTPAAILGDAYGVDPTSISGVGKEGIACDLCHKVWDVKLDPDTQRPFPSRPGILSFEFRRPPDGHQFFAGPYPDVAPGDDTYSPLQQQSRFCAPCHSGVFWNTPIYNSFGEWQASRYSDPVTGKTCQDCHMPSGQIDHFARLDKGGRRRDPNTIFSHRMPGASDSNLLRSAVTLDAIARRDGDRVVVEVTLTNDKTGHHIPTGSPLRQLILLVSTKSLGGQVLAQRDGPKAPDWAGIGDANEGNYAGFPGKGYAKILEELWTEVSPSGPYWNPTRIVSDNRLAAFEADHCRFSFEAPPNASVEVKVDLLFRRAFKALAVQKGWDIPDMVMATRTLHVP